MNHPHFRCAACGSHSIRRSYTWKLSDLPAMAVGSYPFRCLECRQLSWINVWLHSKSKFAKCPDCLSPNVVPRTHEPQKPGFWKRLLLSMGAKRYRCRMCHRRFMTFRFPEERPSAGVDRPSEHSVQNDRFTTV